VIRPNHMELNCNLLQLQDKMIMIEEDKGAESNKPVVYLVREVTNKNSLRNLG
jgi:hypothetical protein